MPVERENAATFLRIGQSEDVAALAVVWLCVEIQVLIGDREQVECVLRLVLSSQDIVDVLCIQLEVKPALPPRCDTVGLNEVLSNRSILDFGARLGHFDNETVIEGLTVLLELGESLLVDGIINGEQVDRFGRRRPGAVHEVAAIIEIRHHVLTGLLLSLQPVVWRDDLLRHEVSLGSGQHVMHDRVCLGEVDSLHGASALFGCCEVIGIAWCFDSYGGGYGAVLWRAEKR